MSADLLLQIAGALLILTAFVLSQMNRLDGSSYPYLLLNLVGGAILTVLAFQGQRWGFVLLEGVWSLVAIGGIIMRMRGKTPLSSH